MKDYVLDSSNSCYPSRLLVPSSETGLITVDKDHKNEVSTKHVPNLLLKFLHPGSLGKVQAESSIGTSHTDARRTEKLFSFPNLPLQCRLFVYQPTVPIQTASNLNFVFSLIEIKFSYQKQTSVAATSTTANFYAQLRSPYYHSDKVEYRVLKVIAGW